MAETTAGRLSATMATTVAGSPTVIAVRGVEELSRPFRYEVDAYVDELDPTAAPGTMVYVLVADDAGNERHLHAAIESVTLVGAEDEGPALCRFHLVPPPYLLQWRRGFRIFQEKNVQEIVTEVFSDGALPDDMFRWSLQASYETREYCVQYDETEWDFVNRLLEDEGIWYAFEHTADGVVMVFGDASDQVPALDPDHLVFTDDLGRHGHVGGYVRAWRRARRLTEGKVSLDDYDLLQPSLDLKNAAEQEEPHAREHYEFPGGYRVAGEGARRAQLRLEERSRARHTATALSYTLGLQPGLRFELVGHPTVEGDHVITRVELDLMIRSELASGGVLATGEGGPELRFETIPRDVLFRPTRQTRRPQIAGVQTARVTGPAGEEIHCDEHGRVKVQFHWDLEGELDDKTTCWIRSTHPHTTGSVTIPRIGWEVLVQFYDGDPDRPVVLGHLYNPFHPPDYALPAQKTVTGHRSNASPGAGSVNEVSFDDAAGSQVVVINAGKDMTIHAANNKTMQTASNSSRKVTSNRTFSVGADERISLQANHTANVGGDHSISVGGNRTVKVSGNAAEEVAG
ncbi:MAG: type VI secretion system tip protein VgrG, partial [Sandaracinaceae bacterium]|nr:type VI secretion system tip protein VgrG [Sandaracinaceae bacterium]